MKQWRTKNGFTITRVLSGRSNAFLLSGGAANILVDTGPKGAWRKLDRRLRGLGVNSLDCLILTHAHFDHAGNAARLKRTYGAPVLVHASEASFLAGGENTVPRGTTGPVDLLVRLFGGSFTRLKRFEPCAYDEAVGGERDLSGYGVRARVLHTPGHSPGSVSVIVDDEIALVGDCVFGVFPRSVLPPFAADAGQMVASWSRLLETRCRLFLPSHGCERDREQLAAGYAKRRL